jgi:ABC-type Fe2+-enterobactin transport system substrate-binding protein
MESPSACTDLWDGAPVIAAGAGGAGGRVTNRKDFILQYSKLLHEESMTMA